MMRERMECATGGHSNASANVDGAAGEQRRGTCRTRHGPENPKIMNTVKKDDSTKKTDNTSATNKSGNASSNSADNKKSGNAKEGRTAESTKAEADKKGMVDNKNK